MSKAIFQQDPAPANNKEIASNSPDFSNILMGHWNTWHAYGVNRLVLPEAKWELVLATQDLSTGEMAEEYGFHVWEERRRLAEGAFQIAEENAGTHEEQAAHKKMTTYGIPDWPMGWIRRPGGRDPLMKQARIALSHHRDSGEWAFRSAADGKRLSVAVDAEANANFRFVLISRGVWGAAIQQSFEKDTITLPSGEILRIDGNILNASTAADGSIRVELPFGDFLLTVGEPLVLPQRISDSPGCELDEAREALSAVLGWTLTWDPLSRRPYLPAGKEWVWRGLKGMELSGVRHREGDLEHGMGPALFAWDSGFYALCLAELDLPLAREVAKASIAFLRMTDGGLATVRMGRHQLEATTNPPILPWACRRIYEREPDKGFLADVYGDLKAYYHWMCRERDRNGDGLFEWGWNPWQPPTHPPQMHARLESGLDNTPLYYDVPFSEQFQTLAMNCIDLSSLMARFAKDMAFMAGELGLGKDEADFTARYRSLGDKINAVLWDDERGVYANRMWTGEFQSAIAPISFYPLMAGIVSPELAGRMIKGWITNPSHFGIEWPLPSLDAAHEEFSPDGSYWRGRVWPPMNYLVYHGLREFDRKAASWLAQRSLAIFLQEWRRDGHVHENYSALTGFGEATEAKGANSTAFLTWGGLMGLMAIEDSAS